MIVALRNRLSFANVIATVALVLAIGGGSALALKNDSVGSKEIKNDGVKSKDLKNDGVKYGDLKETAKLEAQLDFGEAETVLKHGDLKLRAKCLENTTDDDPGGGNPNHDVIRVVLSTKSPGAVFEGDDDQRRGTGPTAFLDPATPELERVWIEESAPTGEADFDSESDEGFAVDAGGKGFEVGGNSQMLALNRPGGPDCVYFGIAHLLK